MYQHHNWQGALLDYPVSKVVCVGSNYAKHIKEMGSATPEEPVLFIKPETALCDLRQPLVLPEGLGSVHHEVELAVLIGSTLRQATEEHVLKGDCRLWRRAGSHAARPAGENEKSGTTLGEGQRLR
ncbi:fumarylacetoacetate hydrolase [Klebsiella pneumoniae]|nr:fumarylacetoacetate hydrolase [Klebsiella pneumoniae]